MKTLNFIRTTIILLFAFVYMACSYATEPSDLYTSLLQVPSNEASIRMKALPEALKQVLIKVSGKKNIFNSPVLSGQIANAGAFLQSYSYTMRGTEDGQKILYLQASFEPKSVNRLLKQANHPIWKAERPSILAWVAVSSQTQQNSNTVVILSQNDINNPIESAFQDNATQLGLPIIFPAMDQQDFSSVSVANICTFNTDILKAATKRYSSDTILAGCISKNSDNSWQGKWFMILNDKIWSWYSKANNITLLSSAVLNNAFMLLTKPLTTNEGSQTNQSITLVISNVNTLETYSKVAKYLRSITQISSVSLLEIDSDNVTLNVVAIGGIEALRNSIKSRTRLTETKSTDPDYKEHNIGNQNQISSETSSQKENENGKIAQNNGIEGSQTNESNTENGTINPDTILHYKWTET